MKRYWMILVLLAGVLLGFSQSARADSCTGTASDIAFGSVSPIANTAVTATGSITVTCTWSALTLNRYAVVCLNLGTGTASTSWAPRYMANSSSNTLGFNVYTDSAYSTIWGSTSSTTASTPITFTLATSYSIASQDVSQTVTVYAQIPSGQTTVPTVGNSTTTYSTSFSGTHTRLDYAFAVSSLLLPSCSSISASTVRFPFSVTANVVNNCNISTTPMSFGNASVLTAALTATSTISVQCTSGDAWQLALNGGSTSASVTARQMKGAAYGATVGYQLYTDSARSTIWGDGTSSTSMVTGTGTGAAAAVTVYGKVPVQTTPRPDTYSDTVTATISF
ncbi:spore coat U domain-containing protein [Burkholderia sp. BCC1977]|uniref:Csu type fimbrial protein n=1 Tax=Burkholderia sp. BCC1977 TaxID=2817440 RepID=UPI002ABD1851|nr:spore coat U domain-containing protein [Burkholderia sp. BCC1977]